MSIRFYPLFFLIFIQSIGLPSEPIMAQEAAAPVLTKALRDSLSEHTKLAHRFSTDARKPDFGAARRHVSRLLFLADSLQIPKAPHLITAGDVEDLAFNYERNKPALGKATDQKECLASAKRCYTCYRLAYQMLTQSPASYKKDVLKQRRRIQSVGMQYYLLTKGFLVNAAQSYAKGDLVTTLDEFVMSYDGSIQPFLLEAYQSDSKHLSDFATYLADSTRNRTLLNCGTVAMALHRYDSALAIFDTLKVRNYELDKVFRNTLAIRHIQGDTLRMMDELREAIKQLPSDIWFRKNLLQLHIDRQEWKQAVKLADKISELDSLDAQVLCMRGQLLEHQGNTQRALDTYLRSYELDSTQANVCSFIGRIYYNRAVQLKQKLFDQKRTQLTEAKLIPLFDQSQPWYERAYLLDTTRKDRTIGLALREMLYYRFTRTDCTDSARLIAQYNEVSRAYELAEFGQ